MNSLMIVFYHSDLIDAVFTVFFLWRLSSVGTVGPKLQVQLRTTQPLHDICVMITVIYKHFFYSQLYENYRQMNLSLPLEKVYRLVNTGIWCHVFFLYRFIMHLHLQNALLVTAFQDFAPSTIVPYSVHVC